MRKNPYFTLALLTLPGCDWFTNGRPFSEVFIEKYVPTPWYWWIPLIPLAFFCLMRSTKGRVFAACSGLTLFFFSGIAFCWQWLSGFGFILAMILIFAITFIGTTLISWAAKMKEGVKKSLPFRFINYFSGKILETGEAIAEAKDAEAKKRSRAKLLRILGAMGSFITVFVLFGGNAAFPSLPKPFVWMGAVDTLLRWAGILMAFMGLIWLSLDYFRRRWECKGDCYKMIWDIPETIEHCPECNYPNPKKDWTCECGVKHHGAELVCEDCRKKRKGIKDEWIKAAKEAVETNNDNSPKPPPAPAPTPVQPAPQARRCSKCGVPANHADPFCDDCGGPITDGTSAPASPQVRRCSKCGVPANHADPFCDDCGGPIG